MLKRFFSATLAAMFVVGWAACVQAETINYKETFSYSSSLTLATLSGSAATAGFTGATSPYYAWTAYSNGTASVTGAVTGSASGLTMTMTSTKNCTGLYITASQLLGGASTTFDVSKDALTVSATLTGGASNAVGYGSYSYALTIGNLTVMIWPGELYSNGLNRVGNATQTALGFLVSPDTPYTISATILKTGTTYSLTYSVASSTKTFTNTLTLTPTQAALVGTTFSTVGIYVEDVTGGDYVTVTNFSVTQGVPEPRTAAMLSTAFIGLLAFAWRKRRN